MFRKLFLFVVVLLLAGLVSTNQAFADAMVAIVLESEGPIEPRLGMYPELKNKDEISLGPGAKLVFSHYYKCEQVTIENEGVLTVRAGSYQFTGNNPGIVKIVDEVCPPILIYIEEMEEAGTIQRGATSRRTVLYTERPDLVISDYDSTHVYEVEFRHTGSRNDPVGEVSKVDGNASVTHAETSESESQVPITIRLRRRVTEWPESGFILKTGSSYEVNLRKDEENSRTVVLVHIGNPDEFLPGLRVLLLDFGNGSLK